jgi:hypothetical protein
MPSERDRAPGQRDRGPRHRAVAAGDNQQLGRSENARDVAVLGGRMDERVAGARQLAAQILDRHARAGGHVVEEGNLHSAAGPLA